jgi:hypothetical protein
MQLVFPTTSPPLTLDVNRVDDILRATPRKREAV